MKACPYCAEEIQDDAVKCRWCGSMLYEEDSATVAASEPTVTFAPPAAGRTGAPAGNAATVAGIIGLLGVVAGLVATVVPYGSGFNEYKAVDFRRSATDVTWSVAGNWGPLVVVVIAAALIMGARRARPGAVGALIGIGASSTIASAASLGALVYSDVNGIGVGAGVILHLVGAALVLLGGLVAWVKRS